MVQNVEMASSPAPEDRELEHSKLRHDLEIARSFGEARPGEWADLFVDNNPSVRVVMLFAGPNLEIHERQLRSMLSYPDQLEVRPAKYSHDQLQEILEQVRHSAGTPVRLHSLGLGKGRVNVWLVASQEELAASLLAQFGDAVELKVGNFSFPMREQPTSSSEPRATAHSVIPPISSEGLNVAISADVVVESGRTGRGTLLFTNRGVIDVTLNTNGAITARIVDPNTGETVGGYVGAHTAPLVKFTAPHGEVVSVPLLVGTASFRREFGFAVPPGTWAVEAVVNVQGLGERRTPPLPIVIIERDVNK